MQFYDFVYLLLVTNDKKKKIHREIAEKSLQKEVKDIFNNLLKQPYIMLPVRPVTNHKFKWQSHRKTMWSFLE